MNGGIVADASALIEMFLSPDPWRGFKPLGSERLHAPSLIDYEVVSALRKARHLTSRIWALRDNLTAHDTSYVALAEALSLPLMTADRRLARAAAGTCEVIAP